jgi:polyhydroxyalkanoate synthesis regulator phasin
MSKFSNIYDIDGNIIRRADQGPFTIEETEQLVDDLAKKVQEHPDNQVYKVYLNNAQKWLSMLYNNMSKEDLMKRLNLIKDSIEEAKSAASEAEQKQLEEISNAMDELKKQYDSEPETAPAETEGGSGGGRPEEMECNMDEPDAPKPVVMDEYTEFEEVK